MRVSVFDPHPVVHQGLTRLLPRNGFSVVSQATDGRDCLTTISNARSAIAITDVRMPYVDGLQILEQVRTAELPVKMVVYSAHRNPTYVARSIALGASDYVLKSEHLDQLISALSNIASGIDEPSELFAEIRNRMQVRKIKAANPRGLTDRELQVLRHLGYGLSNREIAMSLGISVETVKEHVQNILRKQDVNDRTAAAVWAVRQGLAE